MSDNIQKDELRLILIGKTGAGISATGNSILGENVFHAELSASHVTRECTLGKCSKNGKEVIIVDTPGLFYTKSDNDYVRKEIIENIGLVPPGPHVIVLVVNFGRFTKEGLDTLSCVMDMFEEAVWRYMIVLFTGKDQLSLCKQSIEDFITSVPLELKTILDKCENRCVAFNNYAIGEEMVNQVDEFFCVVEKLVAFNDWTYYTHESCHDAQVSNKNNITKEEVMKEPKKTEITEFNNMYDQETSDGFVIVTDDSENMPEEKKQKNGESAIGGKFFPAIFNIFRRWLND